MESIIWMTGWKYVYRTIRQTNNFFFGMNEFGNKTNSPLFIRPLHKCKKNIHKRGTGCNKFCKGVTCTNHIKKTSVGH